MHGRTTTTAVRYHKGKKPEDDSGDRQVAWVALEETYDAAHTATGQEQYKGLAKTKMKQG